MSLSLLSHVREDMILYLFPFSVAFAMLLPFYLLVLCVFIGPYIERRNTCTQA